MRLIRILGRFQLTPAMLAWGILVSLVIGVSGLSLALAYGSRAAEDRAVARANADAEREQRKAFCEILGLYLPRAGSPPATTARGREIQDNFQGKYVALRCAQVVSPSPAPAPMVSPR